MLAVPASYLLLASVTWFFASLIAEKVVPKSDPEFRLHEVDVRDLYGLGVLVIGLSAFLSHLAPMLNWINYLIMNRAGESLMRGQKGLSFYDVTNQVIPCVVGAAIALTSSKIGARLSRGKDSRTVDSTSNP